MSGGGHSGQATTSGGGRSRGYAAEADWVLGGARGYSSVSDDDAASVTFPIHEGEVALLNFGSRGVDADGFTGFIGSSFTGAGVTVDLNDTFIAAGEITSGVDEFVMHGGGWATATGEGEVTLEFIPGNVNGSYITVVVVGLGSVNSV